MIVRWLNPDRTNKKAYIPGVPLSDLDDSLWNTYTTTVKNQIDGSGLYLTYDPGTGITPNIITPRDPLLSTKDALAVYNPLTRTTRPVSYLAVDSSDKRHNVKYYGAKGDESADDTDAILTAIEAVKALGTSSIAPFNNSGGGLYFPAGTYMVQGNIGIDNHVHLLGDYQGAVIKRVDNSPDIPMFINKDNNAVMFGLHGLRIDGNIANNATGTNKHAIDFYIDPAAYSYPAREVFDPRYIIDTCFFFNHLGDAIRMRGQGASFVNSSWIHQVKGRGIYAEYDSHIIGVDIGVTGLEGIYLEGGSMDVVGGKIYHSGNPNFDQTGGTEIWNTSAGLKIFNTNSARITGLEIQDTGGAGILLDTVTGIVISGCLIDTVSAAQNGDPCVDFWNSRKNLVSITVQDRTPSERANTPNTRYAGRFRYSSTGNTLICTHNIPTTNNPLYSPIAPGVPSDTATANSNGGSGNSIIIDGYNSYVEETFVTPYTPNPYTGSKKVMILTGNITVNTPTYKHVGMEIEYTFIQDATGGRTVTFDGNYLKNWTPSTSPNAVNIICFRWNGSKMVQRYASSGLS